jgi:hypothetical protein
MKKQRVLILLLMILFFMRNGFAQVKDSVPHRNIGVTLSCSVLEGNGIRAEYPGYFYSSRTHGFSIAATGKFLSDNSAAFGINAGYYFFLEPSFRDISFFLNYNTSYFFEKDAAFTHVVNFGTQIDFGKRSFLQHSIGLGIKQSSADFSYLQTIGQLKLSLGVYIREMPVVHIHDEWEH